MNFSPDSRYFGSTPYTVTLPDGTTVSAIAPAVPTPGALIGFHQRTGGDRLDLIAVMYEGVKVAERPIQDTSLEDIVRLIVGEGPRE